MVVLSVGGAAARAQGGEQRGPVGGQGRGLGVAGQEVPDAPQLAGRRVDRGAGRVRDHERRHRRAVGEHGRRGADAALEPADERAAAGADGALGRWGVGAGGEGLRAGLRGRAGREPAAATEVEDHRGGHDGHDLAGPGPHREAAPGRPERVGHPGGGGEPVGAAAGEHHGVDALDERARVERVGLAGAGAAAADVDARDRALGAGQHDRRPRQRALALEVRVSDLQTRDVDERVRDHAAEPRRAHDPERAKGTSGRLERPKVPFAQNGRTPTSARGPPG